MLDILCITEYIYPDENMRDVEVNDSLYLYMTLVVRLFSAHAYPV